MRKSYLFILSTFLILISSKCISQPFGGTIFIDSTIITAADPSTIVSTTYSGQGMRTVYDRRIPGWVTINAYLFDIVWNDGLTCEAQINPEFGSVAAATIEADKYALVVGRLPTCLRDDVNALWIHQGTQPFGGGNNSILIHTGQSTIYEAQGILEETFVHEASHTSLDAAHALSAGWMAAQTLDTASISNYAASNPTTEDIAESFLTWLAVRQCIIQISQQNFNSITQSIPNRILYFDNQNFDMYPLCTITSISEISNAGFSVFPNPASDLLTINTLAAKPLKSIEIFNMQGKLVLSERISDSNHSVAIGNFKNGVYMLIATDIVGNRFTEKWIKY